MPNADRSLTLPQNARTLWVHWGRTGGGPRFLAELVGGDLASGGRRDDDTAVSYNPDAEIAARFEALSSTGLLSFPVRTYASARGVLLGLPRLLWNSVRLRRWIRKNNVTRVVSVMESIYESFALPFIVPKNVEYVVSIHDGNFHPGQAATLLRCARNLGFRRADRILTFSDEVAGIIGDQVDLPVTVGSHPPFDLLDAATTARSLPLPEQGRGRPVVGIFGRLEPYKGIELALHAAAILRAQGAPEFELRIVGSGPEERLRETELGREAVWDSRWIPEDEISEVIDNFDIMLLPYTEASQSGPVTLALSHAVPCVATPVGAIPDQVEGFGVVAQDVSARAVAAALGELLADSSRYQGLSAGAIQRLTDQPDWSDLAALVRTGRTTL
ncbi:glycosyltransferase family 4 protein [Corynebacterium variabile]|uniref:glycosyltransferase family 4 protein n=1 Tax=Corynebacterium variabile TaxID=1727 RepID=UPI003F8E091B